MKNYYRVVHECEASCMSLTKKKSLQHKNFNHGRDHTRKGRIHHVDPNPFLLHTHTSLQILSPLCGVSDDNFSNNDSLSSLSPIVHVSNFFFSSASTLAK